jgi:hypothetical protein
MGLFLASIALLGIVVLIAVEVLRLRAKSRTRVRYRHPRRQPLIEDRLRAAFDPPQQQFGEIFVSYTVWKHDAETRLELIAAPPWTKLNEFTRSLVVRHLWRALEKLAAGSVVIVDSAPLRWSKAIDEKFVDQGVDPWAELPTFVPPSAGPQFVKEP